MTFMCVRSQANFLASLPNLTIATQSAERYNKVPTDAMPPGRHLFGYPLVSSRLGIIISIGIPYF